MRSIADRRAPDFSFEDLVAARRHADEFPPHYERVMAVDLDYPIHLVAYRGRLVVLDGVHRLLKAHFLRRRWIEGKIATAAQLHECVATD
jgi:hypothetical protein